MHCQKLTLGDKKYLLPGIKGGRRGGSVVDNMQDYQSWDRTTDPHFSSLPGETINRGPISV